MWHRRQERGFPSSVVRSRLRPLKKAGHAGCILQAHRPAAGRRLRSFVRNIQRRLTIASAFALLAAFVLAPWAATLASAQQPTAADLEVVQVRPNFYMIAGAGGNIAV